MIGHTYKHGGAKHLAQKLGWLRKNMKYITYDIRNFDQSCYAAFIALVIMMLFFITPDDGSKAYRVFRSNIFHSAHETAVKIVALIGAICVYILGQVMSGKFVTSWVDSVIMQLMRKICHIKAYYRIIELAGKDVAEKFRHSFTPCLQYGDDTTEGLEDKKDYPLLAEPSKLVSFADMVLWNSTIEYPHGDYQRDWHELGMEFKADQCGTFLSVFTKIALVRNSAGTAYEYEIKQEGPTFLRRQWVPMRFGGKWHIMPWRRESDYYKRLACSVNATSLEPEKWLSKYVGLMIDSMGTNVVAYEICRDMYLFAANRDRVFDKNVQETKHASADRPSYEDLSNCFTTIPDNVEYNENDDQLQKSLIKSGLTIDHIPIALNRTKLLQMFVWDEKWRNAWAVHAGICLYDDYGNEVNPKWSDVEYTPESYLDWTRNIEYDMETTTSDLILEWGTADSRSWIEMTEDMWE